MAGNDPPIVPPPLAPGARIAVIAPSSPFDRALVLRGMGWLAGRYRLSFERDLFERSGYLAGSDERRLAELDLRLRDPDLGAILVARGGYGLGRIAHRADWAAFRNMHPSTRTTRQVSDAGTRSGASDCATRSKIPCADAP
jgi:muramoyltetrapeptide carboxypeptidase